MTTTKRATGAGRGRPKIHRGESTPIRVSSELLPVIELLKSELAHGNLITPEDLINKSKPLEWVFNLSPYDLMEMVGHQIRLIESLKYENEFLTKALNEQTDQNLKMIKDIRKSNDEALKGGLSNMRNLMKTMDVIEQIEKEKNP